MGPDPREDLRRRGAPIEQASPRFDHDRRLRRRLPHELDAESAHPGRLQSRGEVRCALRSGVEHGVATLNIDDHGVLASLAIAQRDTVHFAGASATAEVTAVAEGVRVNTVLGVKRRQVVVHHNRHPPFGNGGDEREQLLLVEVVRGGERVAAFGEERVRGDGVGDIQREVAVYRQPWLAPSHRLHHAAPVPHEHAIGGEPEQAQVDAALAGLLHARRRDHHARTRCARHRDGSLEPDQLHPVEDHVLNTSRQHRPQLVFGAAEHLEHRPVRDRQRARRSLSERRGDHTPGRAAWTRRVAVGVQLPVQQGRERLTPHRLERRDGQVHPGGEAADVQVHHRPRRPTRRTELFEEHVRIEPSTRRGLQGHRRSVRPRRLGSTPRHLQRLTRRAAHRQAERQAALGLSCGDQPLGLTHQTRVAGQPDLVPRLHTPEIRPGPSKTEPPAVSGRLHGEQRPPRLLLLRGAGVEADAATRHQRRQRRLEAR